jgi:hypothetical protein
MERILALCVALIFVLTVSSPGQENLTKTFQNNLTPAPAQKANSWQNIEPITMDDLLKKMSDKDKCWMDLTPRQYLQDFDVLYKEMTDNYPYFGVAQRKNNVNIEEQYKVYRKQIETCNNDDDFWKLVRSFVAEMKYTGHIQAWGYRYFSELEGLKTTIQEFPQYAEDLAPYIKKLDNPVSQKNYRAMENFYTKLQNSVDEHNSHIDKSNVDDADDEKETETFDNVTTNILQDGKIAYVKIGMFDMDLFNKDKEILLPFYKSLSGYDHLIIDITDNPGGGMDYFNQLVAAPLSDRTYSVSTFLLAKGGENNKHFLRIPEGLKAGKWKSISELPLLSNINHEDLAGLDYFMQENYTVKPSSKKSFQGRIWLLVSENNYSSSEYAAMFSKQSGFATLVGEKTGGDGIGVDPAYIILPNSGLVVQYSSIYGVTADGKNSEEYGTEPDYYVKNGETALEACIRLIKSNS